MTRLELERARFNKPITVNNFSLVSFFFFILNVMYYTFASSILCHNKTLLHRHTINNDTA